MSSTAHILALPPGYVIESYRIERVLGEGSFGITYLAEETHSGKQVAIKELLPRDIATRIAGSTVVPQGDHLKEAFQWALDSFLAEARALAKLSHQNIVPIHRLFPSNGTAYMVMDFVEGRSLRHWLAEHPRPTEEELRGILLPLLEGLEYVHKRDLLHRDIKPDNIFLTEEGRPLLLDFGSARVDLGRTQTMTAVVSEGYSPFEQYQRKARQTPATDLYSLAAVMVRAITGETPATAIDRSEDDAHQKTVSQTHAGRYSVNLLSAVDAAFAVKAKDRPQSVAEWREMLMGSREANRREGMERGLQSASSARSRGRSWLPWVAAALVAVGLGAAVFVLLGSGSASPDREIAVVSMTTPEPLPNVTLAPTPAPAPVMVPPQSAPTLPAPVVPKDDLVDLTPDYPSPMFIGTPVLTSASPNLEKADLEAVKSRLTLKVPKGTENVAKGKNVTSSDPLPIIGTLDLVTDGDADGSDGCYVELAPGHQWLQIDLGAEFNIWKILLWHFHKQPAVYFDTNVQISGDPDFKKDVTVVYNSDHDDSSKLGKGGDPAYLETNYGRLVDGKGVKGRYVRFYSNGNTANEMNHYIETQVYGTPAK